MADWRVLMVEDDERVAAIHRRVVDAEHGFQVIAAVPTGEEAHTLLRRGVPFDLLLLDIELPRTSGIELLRALRQHGGPEVIAVTADRDPRTVHDVVRLGVVDYLVKPFALDRLQDALLRFEQRMRTFRRSDELDQAAIDLLHGRPGRTPLPRNLQRETLEAVRAALLRRGARFSSADEVARDATVARVTARRYLEHLVGNRQAEMRMRVGGPGRPPKLYRLSTPGRDGGPRGAPRG